MPAETTASVDAFAYLRAIQDKYPGFRPIIDTALDGLTDQVALAGGGFEFEVDRDDFKAEVTVSGVSREYTYGYQGLHSETGVGRVCIYPKEEFEDALVAFLDVSDVVVEEPVDVAKVLKAVISAVRINTDKQLTLPDLLAKSFSELKRIAPSAF